MWATCKLWGPTWELREWHVQERQRGNASSSVTRHFVSRGTRLPPEWFLPPLPFFSFYSDKISLTPLSCLKQSHLYWQHMSEGFIYLYRLWWLYVPSFVLPTSAGQSPLYLPFCPRESSQQPKSTGSYKYIKSFCCSSYFERIYAPLELLWQSRIKQKPIWATARQGKASKRATR